MIERLLGHALRALFALPPGVLRRLAGGGSIQRDGATLAADHQLALRVVSRRGRRQPLDVTPFTAARRAHADATRLFRTATIPLALVREVRLPNAIAGRLYAPTTTPTPLLVYAHGGGFVFGDLETHDGICRFLARHAGVRVLAIGYRLAPEHPFPAGADDVLAAFRWAVAHADELGTWPRRIAVGGDSAGACLATVAALDARTDPIPPCFQLLVYPVTDLSSEHPSYAAFAEGFYFAAATMRRMRDLYLAGSRGDDPRASPLRTAELAGGAPAYVATAGFDILRDEGEAYARRLQAAGVAVTCRRFADQLHGFAGTAAVFPSARAALEEIAAALAHGLAGK